MDVSALLRQMTLEEKVAQLTGGQFKPLLDPERLEIDGKKAKSLYPHGIGMFGRIGGSTDLLPEQVAKVTNRLQKHFLENTRLKIPLLFTTEGTSGALTRGCTLFPGNLSAGSMFDENLTLRMGRAIGKELRAMGENFVLAPVIDIVRDLRYGRFEESFSEDTYLVTQNGVAFVRGLQGDLHQGAAATLKHYVGQGISDGGRNTAPVHLGMRELQNDYLVPFAACIQDADAAAVMAAYHEIDGVPLHASHQLLTTILKEQLGFSGLVISDGNGIQLVEHYQEYCRTREDAARLCLEAGIDMELDDVYQTCLIDLVHQGKVSMERVDAAVLRVLELKDKLGLFEQPYVKEEAVTQVVMCRKHVDLAYEMAIESAVLLENKQGLLPLREGTRLGVVGPMSSRKDFAYGDYSYPTHVKEMYFQGQGLSEEEVLARSLFAARTVQSFDELFHDTTTVAEALQESFRVVQKDLLSDTYNFDGASDFEDYELDTELAACDAFVAVLGESSGMGYRNDTGESTDRTQITLSLPQRNLLRRLKELGKPIVLVLVNAKPLELSLEKELCDGILEMFKSGYQGGKAICDLLTGKRSPGGKLPVTLPKTLGQCPVYYSQRITGHKQFWRQTYLETDLKPLYPFGHGLSYTTFDTNVVSETLDDAAYHCKVSVMNTGKCEGSEVLQLYAKKRFTSIAAPERELKAYRKVRLKSGEQQTVTLKLNLASLATTGLDGDFALEDMQLSLLLGTSSEAIFHESTHELTFAGGKMKIDRPVHSNP